MSKILFVTLLSLVLISPFVFAEDLILEVDQPSEYLAGRTYTLTLSVTNAGASGNFLLTILGVPSNWMEADTDDFSLSNGETKEIKITFSPPLDARPSMYSYYFTAKRVTDLSYSQIQILPNVKQLASAIITDVTKSCETCKDSIMLSGMVENVGTKDLNLTFELILNDETKRIDIGVLKAMEFINFKENLDLEGFLPGDYMIQSRLVESKGSEIFKNNYAFEVSPYENIDYTKNVLNLPIGSFITISAENIGNKVTAAQITESVSTAWYIYFYGDKPTAIEGSRYSWNVDIIPGDTKSISYNEINWPVVSGIVFLVLLGLLIYKSYFATDLKKIVRTRGHVKKDDEISISLHVENKARELDNVIVKDHVPADFSIIGKFETMKPMIRKTDSGTELAWKIPKVGAHEHRLLNYKIKANKDLISTLHLPRAKMKAHHRGGTIYRQSIKPPLYGSKTESARISVKIAK